MAQFYFLSILFNIIAGLILVYGSDFTKKEVISGEETSSKKAKGKKDTMLNSNPLFENGNFRLVLGVLTVLVAVMKILSVFRNDVPVIGDIIPAVAGFLAGASLLFEYYIITASVKPELPDYVNKILISGRKYVGYAAIVAGILHFIFPQVLLL